MFIKGKNLRLCYWSETRTGSGPANLIEIEKEEYGYELNLGQEVYAVRYENTNRECYFHCKVLEVNDDGILILPYVPKEIEVFVPWVKEFNMINGSIEKCNLYIEPCERLFEKNKLIDILAGDIEDETIKDNKIVEKLGRGIWHEHGGWRISSSFEKNLKYFAKDGQQELL